MDGDQNSLVGNGAGHIVRGDEPFRIAGEPGAAKSQLFEKPDGVQHGGMLRGGDYDVIAATVVDEGGKRGPLDGQVGRLGPAGRKNHIGRAFCMNQFRSLPPGVLDRVACLQPVLVLASGIAETFREKRPHRIDRLGQDGRGRLVVQVNPFFGGRHLSDTYRVWRAAYSAKGGISSVLI